MFSSSSCSSSSGSSSPVACRVKQWLKRDGEIRIGGQRREKEGKAGRGD